MKLVPVDLIKVLRLMMLNLGNVVQLVLLLHGKSEMRIVGDMILEMLDLQSLQAALHHGLRIDKEVITTEEITMVARTKMVATMELHLEALPHGNSKMFLLHLQHIPAAVVTRLQAMGVVIHLNSLWAHPQVLLLD